MTTIAELIERAKTVRHPQEEIQALLAAGPEALREVLREAERDKDRYQPALYEVIRRSTYPEALPILMAGHRSGSMGSAEGIYDALANSGDPQAMDFVIRQLTDTELTPTRRAAAAQAFNGSRNVDAREALRTVLDEQREEPDSEQWPILLVNAAVAMATMDDHSGAAALYKQLRSKEETARSLAVSAFRIVLDQDTFRELARVCKDRSVEVRREAVDPLFLLGAPAAAELLLEMAKKDRDDQVRYNSTIRFGDILGLELSGTEDLPFAEQEWRACRDGLEAETCYRFGEPITLQNLVGDLVDSEHLRESIAEELRWITGVDASAVLASGGVTKVCEAVESLPFAPGQIHKWGFAQPMPSVPPLRHAK